MRQNRRFPSSQSDSMAPSDAFFWYAEAAAPRLRPLVAGLFMLDRDPDRAKFRVAIERLVADIPRLRQRVIEPSLPWELPTWQEDEGFDLEYHLRELVLPAPANQRTLLDFLGSAFATPMDHLRPLWEAYLIEGLEERRAAVFFKVHHSVVDGVGSLTVFDVLTQASRRERVSPPRKRVERNAVEEQTSAPRTAAAATAVLSTITSAVATVIADPMRGIISVQDAARSTRRLLTDIMVPPVEDPLVRSCTGIGRRLAVLPVSLQRLRRLKGPPGATVNDVVLTVLCGALRRYYELRHLPLNDLHCMVPVNLRQADERQALGNRVGALNVILPLRSSNPLTRLELIRERTTQGKGKGQRRQNVYNWLMRIVGMIPSATLRVATNSVRGRLHVICSNFPGPPAVRYLAGAKIESVYPFAPIILGVPLSIAIMSYDNQMHVGIDCDPAAIPDPERIAELLAGEIVQLERMTVGNGKSGARERKPHRGGRMHRAKPPQREPAHAAHPAGRPEAKPFPV